MIVCTECLKPRLLYAAKKLKGTQPEKLKRVLNGLLYVCGSSLQEIDDNDENKDLSILDLVYVRENLNCFSNVELAYFSRKSCKKDICVYCAQSYNLIEDTGKVNYPKCGNCIEKEDIKRKKRGTVLLSDLAPKKKKAK